MKGKPFVGADGKQYIPFDDGTGQEAYIAAEDIEDMVLQTNGPNGLSKIIMDWKAAYPEGSKEEFIAQSRLRPETVDSLWN